MKAITREEKIMSGENLTPITRKELFLAKAAGQSVITPPPITREEMFLSKIVGGGSGGAPALLHGREVTIRENGTFVETPSEGYDGLSHVTITVDVPQQTHTIVDTPAFPNLDNDFIDEIDKRTIARLSEGIYAYQPIVKTKIQEGATHIVDELPEIGEPCTLDGAEINSVYYKRADRTVYAYVTAEISSALGAAVGWYDAKTLLSALGYSYGGVVTSLGDMTELGTLYFLANKSYWIYSDDAWVELTPAVGGGGGSNEPESPAASEGLAFTLKDDGTYEVSGIGECTDTDIVIPAEVDGIAVTSIGFNAFGFNTSLTSVIIPDSVTVIKDGAFEQCKTLKNIDLGNGVTRFNWGVFVECTSLTSIVIPASVTYIGEIAFAGCTSLTSVTFEGTVAQWNDMKYYDISGWISGSPATYVQCSDGQVAL